MKGMYQNEPKCFISELVTQEIDQIIGNINNII